MFTNYTFSRIVIYIFTTIGDDRLLSPICGETNILPDLQCQPLTNTLLRSVLGRIKYQRFNILLPLRDWIDRIEIDNEHFANTVCELIPAQCPFERDITMFGHRIIRIPPLCKLNPV
jgi:hypothetical protein